MIGISGAINNISLSLIVFLATFIAGFPQAECSTAADTGAKKTTLYLFWGEGCPHCEREKEFLEGLRRTFPSLEVRAFEVWRNKKNADYFHAVMQAAGAKSVGVPATVVGDRLFFGFTERTARAIEDAAALCVRAGCPDTEAVLAGLVGTPAHEKVETLSIPLLGGIDPRSVSLPLLTVVLGGLDSFNPCAFFVLLFLLSLLIHTRSRKRMLFLGGIFVIISGVVYFLFMAAWLNVFLVVGRFNAVTVTAGLIALVVAGINIKDFFFFRRGVSLVIPEKAKPKLYERLRGLLKSPSLPAMTAGAAVLAVTANLYELLCTAGFPMVYTRVLTLHRLSTAQYYLYLVFYNAVYVVPLGAIVAVVTVTLGARKLTEWQGRQLKLVSGMMMLFLAVVILARPELLNNVLAAVVLLAATLIISGLTVRIAKRVNPKIAE